MYEELTNLILGLTYSPTFNVYLVWIVGTLYIAYYGHYFLTTKDENIQSSYRIYHPNGKFNFGIWLAIFPIGTYLSLGTLNDLIVIFVIGGTYIDIYNMMWWSQFLDPSTIFGFLNALSGNS